MFGMIHKIEDTSTGWLKYLSYEGSNVYLEAIKNAKPGAAAQFVPGASRKRAEEIDQEISLKVHQ